MPAETMNQALIEKCASVIRNATRIILTSGAGMGVDSGLPDFRGPEGFWRAYPPFQKMGYRFEQMSNPAWFDRDVSQAWGFFGHRFDLYTTKRPHEGYHILKRICEQKPYFVFTSNVDGHWERAGFDPQRIVECHGTLMFLQCQVPCCDHIWRTFEEGDEQSLRDFVGSVEYDPQTFKTKRTDTLPKCSACGSVARPNVLMFGDYKWVPDRTDAQEDRMHVFEMQLNDSNSGGDDSLVVIELGAGTHVPSVRNKSESLVKSTKNATLIRINPRDYHVPDRWEKTGRAISVPLSALDALQRIEKSIREDVK